MKTLVSFFFLALAVSSCSIYTMEWQGTDHSNKKETQAQAPTINEEEITDVLKIIQKKPNQITLKKILDPRIAQKVKEIKKKIKEGSI